MKRWLLPTCVALATLALAAFHYFATHPVVDASFATRAYLRYHKGDLRIDRRLSDRDLQVLKSMLGGRTYPDSPACGFNTDDSITLTDGRTKIVLCPAEDGCATFRIGESNTYVDISEDAKEWVWALVPRYR